MIDKIIQQYRELRAVIGSFMDRGKTDEEGFLDDVEKVIIDFCALLAKIKRPLKTEKDEKEKKDKK